MTKRVVAIMILLSWLFPALLSFVPIFGGWYTTEENRENLRLHPDTCVFIVNKLYAIISSSISFWIPCTIMVFTYLQIFREANRQEKQMANRQSTAMLMQNAQDAHQVGISEIDTDHTPCKDKHMKMRREHKAARTLGIIMGAFIFCWYVYNNTHTILNFCSRLTLQLNTFSSFFLSCWFTLLLHRLPFFLWYLITSLCGPELCPTPDVVIAILFWIGYSNSTLNPVIYAYFNRDFREAFKNTLTCIFCSCRRDDMSLDLGGRETHFRNRKPSHPHKFPSWYAKKVYCSISCVFIFYN